MLSIQGECPPIGSSNSPVSDTILVPGGVAERSMATVLKTANPKGFMGSNPIPSAKIQIQKTGSNGEDLKCNVRGLWGIANIILTNLSTGPTMSPSPRVG